MTVSVLPGSDAWAKELVVRAMEAGPIPSYMSAEWSALADDDPRKQAAGVLANHPHFQSSTGPAPSNASRFVAGGPFVLDVSETPPTVWGSHDQVLWAEGESLMMAGPTGVGKTTLAGQLVRARMGLETSVLGWPVIPGEKRVLYIAGDRPPQVARSLARIFHDSERAELDERLVIWKGPPAADFAKAPQTLLEMCVSAGADTVVVDSIKDVIREVSKDEGGTGYNTARQIALREGVQVLDLHHHRKAGADNRRPDKLDDIYGSTWLTAGAGSVISLWGSAGDLVIELNHLKQPAEDVGPLRLTHDHGAGRTARYAELDLYDAVRRIKTGATVPEIARLMFSKSDPKPNEIEKTRRRLESLVTRGRLHREDTPRGGDTRAPGTRYYVVQEAF